MLLQALLPHKRGTLESPSVPLSDPAILDMLLSGQQASSGETVNDKTSLGLPAFWRGVTLIGNGIGKLPVCVYRRTTDGREQDRSHPAHRLLRWPNAEMDGMQFKRTVTMHAICRGNGYAAIFREGDVFNQTERVLLPGPGDPLEMVPLDPLTTRPERDRNQRLFYKTRIRDRDMNLLPDSVLHIRGPGGDGLTGYSLVDCLREALGHGLALQKFGNTFFRNNARPSVVLEHPGRLSEEAVRHLRSSWMATHAGADNAWKPAILEEGMKLQAFSLSNEDAQFLGSKEVNVREVANILGLPPHKLGDTTRTSYASLEQENQALLDDAYDPWLVTWEAELMAKLLATLERERDTHYIEFRRQALVRTDMKTRYESFHIGIQDGWLSPDEIRAMENLNPMPNEIGKSYFMPLNMAIRNPDGSLVVPADMPEETLEVDTEDDRSQLVNEVVSRISEDIQREFRRFDDRIAAHAQRAAKKPQQFHTWLFEFMEADHREALHSALQSKVSAVMLLTQGSTGDQTAALCDAYFARMRGELNELSGQLTTDSLLAGVERFCADRQRAISAEVQQRVCHVA